MKDPEPLLLITAYGTLAFPVSKAHQILPHLVTIKTTYEDNKRNYALKTEAVELTMLDKETVITMLVASKLDNKE